MCYTEKYINPFTDFGFKKIFGDEDNTDLLKSLINDILGLEGEKKIKSIIFKNGELLPDSPSDRKAIFDLYCEDERGSNFIVELQKVYQEHFQSRALYYTTFPIQEQAIRGAWDFSLTPIYFIGLLNFEVQQFRDTDEYLHHGQILDIKTKRVMYDKLNMVYVEIPKFKKENYEQFNHLEWWMYVFQNLNRMTDIPKELQGDVIAKAFEKAEFIKLPKVEQDKYHQNLKVYRDLVNSYSTAHKTGMKIGRKEGIKQGIKKGIEQGIKKGIEQGIEQGAKQRNIEIAKNLLKSGISMDVIIKTTGLSFEEIEGLE
jgi:predicted transposase/invertase (TIGR01784 family)